MKVLFITRKYPPQVGGMENFSHGLIKNIQCDKSTVILNKKQIHLIWWLPYALLAGIIKSFSADVVHLGDGVLSPLGLIIKFISRKPVIITAHGLDITYNNFIYKSINIPSLKYLDKIICVSQNTKKECLAKNISEKKLTVIGNGIDINKFVETQNFASLDKKTLLTVGRLVKRKGHEWFIRNIMPRLEKDVQYIIVGDGPEKQNIKKAISELKLQENVIMKGRVSDEELKQLYNQADLFIMPNIKVKGDREGFGIVAIEAASIGLPVIASNIEGIKDAIINNKNGFLVEEKNIQQFHMKINTLLSLDTAPLREKIKEYTQNNYNWEHICNQYLEQFKHLT